jgi:transcriptional regulator of met regulon
MDPAVLGTLRIGLDALEAETRTRTRRQVANNRQTTGPRIRVTVAGLLRRTAELLEPHAVGDGAPEAG